MFNVDAKELNKVYNNALESPLSESHRNIYVTILEMCKREAALGEGYADLNKSFSRVPARVVLELKKHNIHITQVHSFCAYGWDNEFLKENQIPQEII